MDSKQDKNKVVLFPKWQENLEEESLADIKAKNYNAALNKIDELLHYKIRTHAILTGKLICLMELGRYTEAIALCGEILDEQDSHYYEYLFLYVNLLFQANELELLIEQIDYERNKEDLPFEFRAQFDSMYTLSKSMLEDKKQENALAYEKELQELITTENYLKQWLLVEKLRQAEQTVKPFIYEALMNPTIHPVVKTSILFWLKEQQVTEEFPVVKFHVERIFHPEELVDVEEHSFFKEVLIYLTITEQENPTLYALIIRQLYRFLYVRYPFFPAVDEAKAYADALSLSIKESLADVELQEETNEKKQKYITEIHHAEAIYLSIIEE